jgi:hypothetical protein
MNSSTGSSLNSAEPDRAALDHGAIDRITAGDGATDLERVVAGDEHGARIARVDD